MQFWSLYRRHWMLSNTRLMTQVHGEAVNKVADVMYVRLSSTIKRILKEEGWVGLTCDMCPRVLHSACFSVIGYFAFETARLKELYVVSS